MSTKEKICVDSNRQGIEITMDMSNRIKAESRVKYYHFCSLNTLKNILSSKALKLNNIENFQGVSAYEKESILQDFRGQIFIACLSSIAESEYMWENFGDNGSGVCLEFTFPKIFHDDVIDKSRLIQAISYDGKQIEELGFSISKAKYPSWTCNPNRVTSPIVEIQLSDVEYANTSAESTVFMNQQAALNLSTVSTTVPNRFYDEHETRVKGILRSTREVHIDRISYLLVPIKLEYMNLNFGDKVREEEKEYYLSQLVELQKIERQRI